MKSFLYVVFFILILPKSEAQPLPPDLQVIANSYEEKYFYYESLLPTYAEHKQVIDKFKQDLQSLAQMPSDIRKTSLWSDLYYDLNGKVQREAVCEPYYWNLESYYNAANLLNFSEVFFQSATIDDFNRAVQERFNWAEKGIEGAIERLEKMVADQKIPTEAAMEPLLFVLDDTTQPAELGFYIFEQNFDPSHCPAAYCDQVDVQSLRIQYDSRILPLMRLVFEKFETLKPLLIKNTPLVIPPSIQQNCYSATLRGIYSDLTPSMLLKKGEAELLRSEREMLNLLYEMGEPLTIPMSISAFIEQSYLKMSANPQFQIKDADEYRKIYLDLEDRMRKEVTQITSAKLNYTLSYALIVDDPQSAKEAWYNFNKDIKQGTFYTLSPPVNGYLTFELAWLFFHEGVPGHHLEQSVSYDASSAKPTLYEKNKDFSPYVEGWGLYVEELALDLNFYQAPQEKFAFYDAIRLRALRMILAYRYYYDSWTDAQAIALTDEHLFGGQKDAIDTIARPRHWSAQAVGYMVGKTILLSLRSSAHRILGSNCFTLQEYNDSFLLKGSAHLDTLVSQTAQWIESKKCYRDKWNAEQIEEQLRLDIRASFGIY